jgi:hypothetical protein
MVRKPETGPHSMEGKSRGSSHETALELVDPIAAAIDAGTDFTLSLRMSCSSGCDMGPSPLGVFTEDGTSIAVQSVRDTGDVSGVRELVIKAPLAVGQFVWTVRAATLEVSGVSHQECSVQVRFATVPHTTSMAVWDVSSPVVANGPSKAKVGVKCSASCRLTGQTVVVRDQAGTAAGVGRLGDLPWPGTSGLYWVEVQFTSPAAEGVFSWFAAFAANDVAPAHDETLAAFSFRTVRRPEHTVTIEVVDAESAVPLEDADVRLGVYRGTTDGRGRACLEVPKGSYELQAWRIGHKAPPQSVTVVSDVVVRVEASVVPEKDPDDELWM